MTVNEVKEARLQNSSQKTGAGIHLRRALLAGLIAGIVSLLFLIAVELYYGGGALNPLRMLASLPAGEAALTTQFSAVAVVILGGMAALALWLTCGLGFGLLTLPVRGADANLLAYAGLLYGMGVYLLHLTMIRLFFPWLAALSPWRTLVMMTLFFGLPLGYALAGLRGKISGELARGTDQRAWDAGDGEQLPYEGEEHHE